jgi:hypothetical protein
VSLNLTLRHVEISEGISGGFEAGLGGAVAGLEAGAFFAVVLFFGGCDIFMGGTRGGERAAVPFVCGVQLKAGGGVYGGHFYHGSHESASDDGGSPVAE